MKLLAHFIATDVRRFRALIALWVLVAVAGFLVDANTPFAYLRQDNLRLIAPATTLLQLADVLLTLTLIAFVVQAHPLVGSDAFWMTRPIRWNTLLSSKLLLLSVLIVGVPLACELVHMAAYDVPAPAMTRAALQTLLFRTLALVAMMAIAAVTPNIARFALVCGGMLLAAAVAVIAASVLFETRQVAYGIRVYPFNSRGIATAWERDGTATIVAVVIAVAAALTLLTMQYRLRAIVRSVTMGVCGAALAGVVAWMWPWTLLAAPSDVDSAATRSIALSGDAEYLHYEPLRFGGETTKWMLGWVPMHLSGLPSRWYASATLLRASIDYDGGRVPSDGHSASILVPFGDRDPQASPLSVATKEVLEVPRLGIGPGEPGTNQYGFSRPKGVGRAIAFVSSTGDPPPADGRRGTYRGEIVLSLTEMEIAAVLPLRTGTTFEQGAFGLTIDEILQEESRFRIRGRLWTARTVFDETPRPSYKFYVRTRQRTEASELDTYQRRTHGPWTPLAPTPGFEAVAIDLVYRVLTDAGPIEKWTMDNQLVIVRSAYRGNVIRTLELRDVRVPGT